MSRVETDTVMIGGPADGLRVAGEVMPRRVWQERHQRVWQGAGLSDLVKTPRHLYVAETLRAGDETFHFYRHERIPVPLALAMLLQGYKP